MKKILPILLIMLCILQWMPPAVHAVETGGCHTLQAGQALAGNGVYKGTAKAAILYELNTKTLVYAHNPDQRINPTGLIKLLSALIVLEEGNLDDVVTVQRSTLNSVSAGAVSAGLKAGEEITLRDLLYCVMVSSANDASAVMAEHVAGSQAAFVEKMNQRAATAGCGNTHFTNVHGLKDDKQYSTARDLAILLEIALQNQAFRDFFGVTEYTVPETNLSSARNLSTTNYMMDADSKYYDSRVTGGKPAAAATADRSMACVAQSEDAEYLCVIISAQARTSGSSVTRYTNFDEATSLLNLGFNGYRIQQVVNTQQPFGMYPVSGGENNVVVGTDGDLYALLPIDCDMTRLQLVDYPDADALRAPVAADSAVGRLEIYYDSILIGEVSLLARHNVAPLGSTIRVPQDDEGHQRDLMMKIVLWGGISIVVLGGGFAVVRSVRRRIRLARRRRMLARERRGN